MEEIQHSLLFCMDPYGNGISPYNPHMKKTLQDLFHQPLVDWSTSGGLSFDLLCMWWRHPVACLFYDSPESIWAFHPQ